MRKEEEILQELLEAGGEFMVSGLRLLKAAVEMLSLILRRSGRGGELGKILAETLSQFSEEIGRIVKDSEIMGVRKESPSPRKKKGFTKIEF